MLKWAFYRSNRLFKLLTCGLKSQIEFGKNGLQDKTVIDDSDIEGFVFRRSTAGKKLLKSIENSKNTSYVDYSGRQTELQNLKKAESLLSSMFDLASVEEVDVEMKKLPEDKLNEDVEAAVSHRGTV